MFLIYTSLLVLSLPTLSHPCHPVSGETAGINHTSSAHPEGCDSEFLCQVYFDIDEKLHAAAARQRDAEGIRHVFPFSNAGVPWEEAKGCPVPRWPANESSLGLHHRTHLTVSKAGTQRWVELNPCLPWISSYSLN